MNAVTAILRSIGSVVARIWRSGCIGKIAVGFGALILISICSAPFLPEPDTASNGTASPAASGAALVAAASDPAPSSPAAPTNTPEPTATPAPTNTPEPTATPTETPVPPTPTPLPEPVVIEGRGQTVTDPFTPPAAISRMVFTHTGSRNFVVKTYDEQGNDDLVINTIGNYTGSVPLFTDQSPAYLEIDADGPWSVTIEPVGLDDAVADGLEGRGAFVSQVFRPKQEGAVPYRFTHTGDRNFAVYLYCGTESDLLQNEIGAVDNQAVARFNEGPCLWVVEADGEWSIRPR